MFFFRLSTRTTKRLAAKISPVISTNWSTSRARAACTRHLMVFAVAVSVRPVDVAAVELSHCLVLLVMLHRHRHHNSNTRLMTAAMTVTTMMRAVRERFCWPVRRRRRHQVRLAWLKCPLARHHRRTMRPKRDERFKTIFRLSSSLLHALIA